MTKTYIKKSQRIYEELYKSLSLIYSRENIHLEFNRGVGHAIKMTNFYLQDSIHQDLKLHDIDVNNIEITHPEDHNFYYRRMYGAIKAVEAVYLRDSKDVTCRLDFKYHEGCLFVTNNLSNYMISCLIEERPNLNPKIGCESYIKKSQRICEKLHSILDEEFFDKNASQQFNEGALNAIRAINIGINNLLINYDLHKININDIENTGRKNHNFYYNKILTEISETYKTLSEQRYNYIMKEAPEYYATEEVTEYDKGIIFIFFNANNYIKSCLIEEEENG